ncbi:putative polypeptide N-acetylgalactosaminyltransferase 10, partial [Trichinella murrelli]
LASVYYYHYYKIMALGRCLRRRLVLSIGCVFGGAFLLLSYFNSGSSELDIAQLVQPSFIQPGKHFIDNVDRKIDWEDYVQRASDLARHGPGEQGEAFYLPNVSSVDHKKGILYKSNGFNALVSDYLALNRSIRDFRPKQCIGKSYLAKLEKVSVVIPFYNEHWTTLLRTVHSVVNRSPVELLQEVILADDFSDKPFLKQPLEAYVRDTWPGLVRIVRARKREGLIRARLLGSKAAISSVLVFLDSHSECGYNWLPPLLEPIALNYRTVTCPFVDVIDHSTFLYRPQDQGARGSFDWELYYKRLPLLPEDAAYPDRPFNSPVMAGGYFAISTKWFWELGGYDEGLDIWGGEQYELSFKIWQCGGTLIDVPCSHVGHIYREFSPFANPGAGDFVGRNYKRVAEVWMDEYKEYVYMRRPHYRKLDPGDISKQKEIRKRLGCKPFKWFMQMIAFDQSVRYPPVEMVDVREGEIRSIQSGVCVTVEYAVEHGVVGLADCKKGHGDAAVGEQFFIYTTRKEIKFRNRRLCFDVPENKMKAPVILYRCHDMQGNQAWRYNSKTMQIVHPVTNMCLDADFSRREVFMQSCNLNLLSQRWSFGAIVES